MAKSEGYRSRATYKLKQLSDRYGLMRRGAVVVDLGAAPGGWLQIALEEAGGNGFVLGVDLQKISKINGKNVETIVADINKSETREMIREKIPRPADAVISDAAPSLSGVPDVDQSRSLELVMSALGVAEGVLAPGGNFLVKAFQGSMLEEFLKEVRKSFEFVKVTKPMASRKGSAEVYVVGKGFKGH